MSDDARLDQFADAGGDGAGDREPERPAADAADDTGGAEGDETEAPPTVTYRFAPAGASCVACGAAAERLWRSDAGPVCPACKAWDA